MSLLIKGMKMPSSCRECNFLSYQYIVPVCSVTRQIPTYPLAETLEQALSKRMNGCPLEDVTEEVRRGRWIMHIDDLFPAESTMECDQCHEEQPLECDDKYCPNCGSRMDLEKMSARSRR